MGIVPSIMAARSIGIPIKLLHEAEGNMNCYIGSVTMTARDGRTSKLEQVAIRGSQVRFMILPDMLKNAPMFKKQGSTMGAGRGRGGIAAGRGKPKVGR